MGIHFVFPRAEVRFILKLIDYQVMFKKKKE